MLDWKRSRTYLAAAVVAASLGACGKDPCPAGTTGTPPNCVPIPSPCPAGTTGTPGSCLPICTQSVVEAGSGPAKARTFYYFDFSVPDSGRLDITVDWTNPADAFGVYLVPANTCTLDEFNARSCNFIVRSEVSTVKPRKVSTTITAGNYRWLIANFSNNDESISYQFVLSKTTCPALAGALPSVSAQGRGVFPAITRAESR